MIADITYKLARKALGQSFYDFISFELLGRKVNYEKWETYRAILDHYQAKGLEFKGKAVAELGCGRQYFTALGFLALGAEHVHMVEPKLRFSREALTQHMEAAKRFPGRPVSTEDAVARISCHRDTSSMGREFDGTLDLICSFTVLEHVGDLEGCFADMARLLRPGGTAYHMVDLSDHTYQVFARWRALASINHNRALYHLRYSPGAFRVLNDPKCYMNRELLPAYLAYARRHGLTVESLETAPYAEPFRVHPQVLARAGEAPDPALLNVTSFSLRLRK